MIGAERIGREGYARPRKPHQQGLPSAADVRYEAHYGLKSDIALGRKVPNKRLMHRSKQHLYSITSSAQPTPLGRAGEPDELFGQAAKTGKAQGGMIFCAPGRERSSPGFRFKFG